MVTIHSVGNRRERKALRRGNLSQLNHLKVRSLERWSVWYHLNKDYLFGNAPMTKRTFKLIPVDPFQQLDPLSRRSRLFA